MIKPKTEKGSRSIFSFLALFLWEGLTLENRVSKLEVDMSDVKTRLAVAEAGLRDVKEDISSIKDDTKWLRRTITNAFITAIIGGVIGLFFLLTRGGM